MTIYNVNDLEHVKKLKEKLEDKEIKGITRNFLICKHHNFPLFPITLELDKCIKMNYQIMSSVSEKLTIYLQNNIIQNKEIENAISKLQKAIAHYIWISVSMYRNNNKVCVKCYTEALKFKGLFKEFVRLTSS